MYISMSCHMEQRFYKLLRRVTCSHVPNCCPHQLWPFNGRFNQLDYGVHGLDWTGFIRKSRIEPIVTVSQNYKSEPNHNRTVFTRTGLVHLNHRIGPNNAFLYGPTQFNDSSNFFYTPNLDFIGPTMPTNSIDGNVQRVV